MPTPARIRSTIASIVLQPEDLRDLRAFHKALADVNRLRIVRRLAEGKGGVSPETHDLIERQAVQHRFFHWDLAFPAVFTRDRPGFDLVLGNPPWKSLSPDLKEFFEPHAPEIRTAKKSESGAR